jgi:hypothetical protein
VTQPQDPLRADLDEAWRQYQLLAAKVEPGQGEGGRRVQPSSRPPLQVDPVSHMDELRRYLAWWIGQARWSLQPTIRIDITNRTGARCPYCYGTLIAWLYGDNPEPPEVVCLNRLANTHARAAPEGGNPWRWEKQDWARLGVLTGMRDDERFTTLRGETATA